MLLRAFIEDGDVGIICPRLQYIIFTGNIDFSLETLRLFLNGRHGKTPSPDILPWKRIVIDLQGIGAKDAYKQILDLISLKKAEGLDVYAFSEYIKYPRDRIFDY